MTTTTAKPKGYAKVPIKHRRIIADAALAAAGLGVMAGLGVPPEMQGLWLRIPALLAAAALTGANWYVYRRLAEQAPLMVRNGLTLAAVGASLLAMAFHKAGGLTSLGGLTCFVSILAARGSVDLAKPQAPPDWRRTGWSVLRDNIESLAGALIIVLIVWHFCLEAFKIPTGSMLPTLYGDNVWGDRVLVDKFAYEFTDPARWEPVVFRYPLRRTEPYVKRCIGQPGEQVLLAQGDVYLRKSDNAEVTILRKAPDAREVLWYRLVGPVRDGKQFKAVFGREASKAEYADGAIRFGPGDTLFYPKDDSARQVNVRDHDPSGEGAAADEVGYGRRVVGDLRIRARVRSESLKAAPVEFVLVRDDDEYALRLSASSCTLLTRKRTGEKTHTEWEVMPAPALDNAMRASDPVIEFSLADGVLLVEFESGPRTQVQIGSALLEALQARDAELARAGKPLTPLNSTDAMHLASIEPTFGRRGQIRIHSPGAAAIDVLGIDRDIYYIGRILETAEGPKELPFAVALKDEQYFVLGDNSQGSKDCRYWIELVLEMADGKQVAGGLDDQGQYMANLLHRTGAGETLKYRDRAGREQPFSALMSLQRVARFSRAERGMDQPSDAQIYANALAGLKKEARDDRVNVIPFITSGGHEVPLDVSSIKSFSVRLVPYVERQLFVGRPFAVFLWPNRMKLID